MFLLGNKHVFVGVDVAWEEGGRGRRGGRTFVGVTPFCAYG